MTFKVAIAGFQHETNSFSPAMTTFDDFLKLDSWPALTTGNDVLGVFRPLNIPIGGFINAANDWQLIPIAWASAEPYGLVTNAAYDRICELLCEGIVQAGDIDAIYLDLHGAMVSEQFEDGEGELLQRIRQITGKRLPIVISLDLHANVTPLMAALSDAITIYQTYPHIDMAASGARAFALTEQILLRGKKPYKTYRQVPYLIPLSSQHTGSQPCRDIYEFIGQLPSGDLCSTDFACGFPPADIEHCGPAIVTYAWQEDAATDAAESIYRFVLAAESQFTDSLLSADSAVSFAIEHGRPGAPIVIADVQDNPGAGGTADTTGLLHALIAQGARGAVVATLCDAQAAALAHQAGQGATLSIQLGGKSGPDGVIPLQSSFVVAALSDGVVTCHGTMMGGMTLNLGPVALLRVDDANCDVSVVVTSSRIQCLDQALIKQTGIDPAEQTIVALKSTLHFRADFESIASDIIMAACPGAHPCQLDKVVYQNLRTTIRLGPNGSTMSAPCSRGP